MDNTVCSRRFHLSYDDEANPIPEAVVKCPFCDEIVFSAENHPEVLMARQENLVKTAELSDLVMESCTFKDNFSIKPKNNS